MTASNQRLSTRLLSGGVVATHVVTAVEPATEGKMNNTAHLYEILILIYQRDTHSHTAVVSVHDFHKVWTQVHAHTHTHTHKKGKNTCNTRWGPALLQISHCNFVTLPLASLMICPLTCACGLVPTDTEKVKLRRLVMMVQTQRCITLLAVRLYLGFSLLVMLVITFFFHSVKCDFDTS